MADLPDNVKLFPGVDALPTPPPEEPKPKGPSPVKLLFRTALAVEARDLVVIGTMPDGDLFVASQSEDPLRVTGLLAKAVTWMTLPEDPEYGGDDDEDDDTFPTG